MYIAERAKKCLDYCSTLFINHLVICFFVNVCLFFPFHLQGFPIHLFWWITMVGCMIAMILLSLGLRGV